MGIRDVMRGFLFLASASALSGACSDGPKTGAPTQAGQPALNPASAPLAVAAAPNADAASASAAAAAAEKQEYLAHYVQPDTIVRSFHAAEGMWVDCVDINRQPSMLTPQMVGQTIDQPPPLPAAGPSNLAPSGPSTGLSTARTQPARLDVEDHANELDENGSVRHCDVGTIPMRRTTAADLDRFATLHDFFAKRGRGSAAAPSSVGWEYASQGELGSNWGMQSLINIWQPFLDTYYNNSEHSISQIWVQHLSQTTLESAEAGWAVNPLEWGDTRSRLFLYWTADDYMNTGCYNVDCKGFVQTNHSVTLGGYYNTISSMGGAQYEIEVTWAKSSATANWWLLYQGTTWLGYLPASLFTHGMQTQANITLFGGEISNSEPGGSHTETNMGSGQFASAGWQYAAYQRHLQYIDLNYNTIDVNVDDPNVTNSNCYSLISGYQGSGGWGAYEFFGGPGYNSNCQ